MPSVGIRSVGCVHIRSSAGSAVAATFFDQSIARFCVRKRLVSSTTGAASPSANSAYSARSEEHTSELQSRFDLVCRLLLEKKKKIKKKRSVIYTRTP